MSDLVQGDVQLKQIFINIIKKFELFLFMKNIVFICSFWKFDMDLPKCDNFDN